MEIVSEKISSMDITWKALLGTPLNCVIRAAVMGQPITAGGPSGAGASLLLSLPAALGVLQPGQPRCCLRPAAFLKLLLGAQQLKKGRDSAAAVPVSCFFWAGG